MNKLLLFILLLSNFFCISQPKTSTTKVADSIDVLINLADKENLGSNFENALNYSIVAVKLANISNIKEEQAKAYNSLASTYEILNDNDSAEKYFLLTLKFARELDNDFIISSALNGLGNVYSKKEETLNRAINYYNEAFEFAEKTGKQSNIAAWYLNMASLFLDFNKTDEALPYLDSATETLETYNIEEPVYFATLYYLKALYNKQKKEYTTANNYLENGISISKENNLYPELIDNYQLQYDIYQEESNYALAIKSLQNLQFYKDLIFNKEKSLKLEELNTQFKVSEYQKELTEAKLQTETANFRINLITAVVVSFVLFSILVIFIINTFKVRQRHKDLDDVRTKTEHLTNLKSELLTSISHELRTPLYGIMGITSMLSDDKTLDTEHQNLISSLQFSGNRLQELVNKILRITEIESNRVAEKKAIINLHVLINDLVKSLNYSATEKNNDIVLNLPESIDNLYNIDSLKLTEVLDNLISNAIKFTSNGRINISVLLVETKNDIDFLQFKIEDTGIGVASENHKLIFENFRQATEKNTSNGSGLGLSIVKNHLETLGGSIMLESALGLGSVFSFIIPCQIATPDIIAKSTMHKSKKPLRVLVVEDNKINQMITNKLILSIGHICTISNNGLEAVERCKTDDFDLVLMDINMPIMNGFEASKNIKSFKPSTKIVALTALEISEVKEQCNAVGINGIVNKPIGKNQLNEIIQMNVAS
ncbi:ATP-binding protein [Algibacter sp. L4_22]|uniref:tetratricopeptide repeat-containing hybrid sensor histidine kinase/response regulator n=1 Tax=Algibacter sp. L4_22 TaxID=2942477 RepID=UPI00201B74A2|nr:ATP-binding protein [Algibacter sp. L4_22]MCL5127789.1 response regulator [Algibacter sp. L4_22]